MYYEFLWDSNSHVQIDKVVVNSFIYKVGCKEFDLIMLEIKNELNLSRTNIQTIKYPLTTAYPDVLLCIHSLTNSLEFWGVHILSSASCQPTFHFELPEMTGKWEIWKYLFTCYKRIVSYLPSFSPSSPQPPLTVPFGSVK
jgi:hypothetical protein